MKSYNLNKKNSGMSLPITFMFILASSGFVFAFYNKIFKKNWLVDRQFAEYKAELNAESGIAYAMANHLYRSDFECYNEYMIEQDKKNIAISGLYPQYINNQDESACPYADNMGDFDVASCYTESELNDRFNPYAISIGKAYIKNMRGQVQVVEHEKRIELTSASSLSDFLYLTDSEKAGGAPFVFDGFPTYDNRREVNFGPSDSFNQLWPNNEAVCDVKIKSNGSLVMSNFGCPEFNNTITVTENDEGEVNDINYGSMCNEDSVFDSDLETRLDTAKTTCLPPDGYDEMKAIIENSTRHITLDATSKLNWNPLYFSRDTLIMTDIEFTAENGGGIKVKQWWFLVPPYLSTGVESPFVLPSSMNNNNDGNCNLPQLYLCPQYVESMQNFHSKNVSTVGYDSFINTIVQGTYGFHHYDYLICITLILVIIQQTGALN